LTSFTDVLGLIASFTPNNTGFVLSAIEHMLSVKQREDVEARLANYNIPFQILQMVAEQCECDIETRSTRKDLAL
jgi:anion-transporting  ArsA/GET3 family ATPase